MNADGCIPAFHVGSNQRSCRPLPVVAANLPTADVVTGFGDAEQEVDIINLSIGSYDPSCVGDCIVCSAVSNVAAAGPTVVAAAVEAELAPPPPTP